MSITLNTKVYSFEGFTPERLTLYQNHGSGIPTEFSPLTFKNERMADGRAKVKVKLKVPVVQTEDTACGCVGELVDEDIVDIIVTLGNKSTTARRTDVRLRIEDLVKSPEFTAAVTSLVQPSS